MNNVLLLLLLVLGISLWLGWTWLALISIFVMFLMFVGREKKAPSKSKTKQEEVLTPVIITDAGEPPMLYPDKFKLKVYTKGWGSGGWLEAAQGAASLVNLGYGLITGKSLPNYSWDERWDVKKIRDKKKKDGKK